MIVPVGAAILLAVGLFTAPVLSTNTDEDAPSSPQAAQPWADLACEPKLVVLQDVIPGPGEPVGPPETLSKFLAQFFPGLDPSTFVAEEKDMVHEKHTLTLDGELQMVIGVGRVGKAWAVTGYALCPAAIEAATS